MAEPETLEERILAQLAPVRARYEARVQARQSDGDNSDGGSGSGNWGHAGRPGQRGGSAPGGGSQNRVQLPDGGYTSASRLRRQAGQQSSEEEARRNPEGGSQSGERNPEEGNSPQPPQSRIAGQQAGAGRKTWVGPPSAASRDLMKIAARETGNQSKIPFFRHPIQAIRQWLRGTNVHVQSMTGLEPEDVQTALDGAPPDAEITGVLNRMSQEEVEIIKQLLARERERLQNSTEEQIREARRRNEEIINSLNGGQRDSADEDSIPHVPGVWTINGQPDEYFPDRLIRILRGEDPDYVMAPVKSRNRTRS